MLMGALVATLLCAYTIAKVLRDALFLAEFGALALPYAYIAVAVASAGFVWLEGRMARRLTRLDASRLHQYLAIALSLAAVSVYPHAHHLTAAFFYLWTGSQAMMLLPHFWVLALDVWDSRRARRVFPLLTGCGLIGGIAGGAFAGWATPLFKRDGLMWALFVLLLLAHGLTRLVETHRARRPGPMEASPPVSRWEIIRRSPYLRVLAAGLALSVVVSTLVDFQFKYFIQRAYPDPHALTEFLGKFYVGLNTLALIFQFSAAGLLLQRMGLGVTTGLQPLTALVFTSWMVVSTGWWAIVAMRWIQGVVFQTVGKSSAEIYYSAVRPPERRFIKPAVDMLVERWSDAVVGVMLIVMLHLMGVSTTGVAVVTAGLAVAWLAVLFFLNRQYGLAFESALGSRWIDSEAAAEALRTPQARKALLEALRSDDERRVVMALEMSCRLGDKAIARAVRDCLRRPSPAVRAAAVETLEAMGLADREGRIEQFLQEPNEALRRAAVSYVLARDGKGGSAVRRMLDGDDPALRQYALDALFEHPYKSAGALSGSWVDARMEAGGRENLLLAARALGALPGVVAAPRLHTLLSTGELDVQRAALLSAMRRPRRELLEVLLPLLLEPQLSYEARGAIAAIGDPAVRPLTQLLDGRRGTRVQALASRTLARIATPRAVDALLGLVYGPDLRLRQLGLQGLTRIRVRNGRPVLPQGTAHRLFLRELSTYRAFLGPALRIQSHPEPDVRLLAESFRESSDLAVERALRALACWYEPKPLSGALEHLISREPGAASPALEYLGHILPRKVFQPVIRIFEEETPVERANMGPTAALDGDGLAESIRIAWRSGDSWLRACAVRASRHAEEIDVAMFQAGDSDGPFVRAELKALFHEPDHPREWPLGAPRAAEL